MKREHVPFGVSVVLLVPLSGCMGIVFDRERIRGSGTISEEIHTFSGLTGVELGTIGELDIRLGDTEELRISADDNLLEYFDATQDGDTLRIRTRRGVNLRPSEPVRYTLTVREVEFIGLSSSGDATAPALAAEHFEIRIGSSGDLSVDGIEANSLDVTIGSSGDLSMDDLRSGSLTVRITSSGNVRIGGGVVDSQDITISSSGDYDGESVRSAQVTARLSSNGTARLWAEESLNATLNSSGSVYYKGDPEVFDNHNSSGRVRRIQ